MRWILTTSEDGRMGRTITSVRTMKEGMESGRKWLERHPGEKRCYLHDSRGTRSIPVSRKRVAHRHSQHTFKDRSN
jgi:hypothetical protein